MVLWPTPTNLPVVDDIGAAFNVGGKAFSSAGRWLSDRSLMSSTSSACLNTEAEEAALLAMASKKQQQKMCRLRRCKPHSTRKLHYLSCKVKLLLTQQKLLLMSIPASLKDVSKHTMLQIKHRNLPLNLCRKPTSVWLKCKVTCYIKFTSWPC